MAKQLHEERGKTSVSDIAATLLQNHPAKETSEVELEEQVEDDQSDLEEIQEDEDESPTGGEDEDHIEDFDDAEDGDEEEGEEQPDDESEDEAEYLDIQDSDLISVTVDGEEQEVSIAALKKAYSGEGAIDKRLQDATETQKAAHADRTRFLEARAAQERELAQALDGLDESLFKGVIPPPDEQARRTNPEQYLRHKEAYDEDQKRISQAKKFIEDKKAELATQRQTRLQEYAQEAGKVIAREIPELVNPKTSQQAFASLASTAMRYGYTQEEINSALDPRMFMLVRDADRYAKLMEKASTRDVKDLTAQSTKKVRRLRSGNTLAKNRVRQADQKQKKAVERARKTGKPADVAETLLVSRKR